jgi:NMT1/THI5 like protein
MRALRTTWIDRAGAAVATAESIHWVVDEGGYRDVLVRDVRLPCGAIGELSPPLREALAAVDVLGLADRDAAGALRIRRRTLTSRLDRARTGRRRARRSGLSLRTPRSYIRAQTVYVQHHDMAPGRRDTGARMRRTGSRSAAGMVSVLCLLLAFAGCGGDERADGTGILPLAAATGRPEIHRLKVGAGPITDLKQLYVADAKGFFREQGLEVDIVYREAPGTVIPAVVSGDLDLGWLNSLSLLRARGLDMRFFAGGVYQRPGHWNSAIMVRKDSPIRTPEQLRGRTIAINSMRNINELVIRAYLDREGVAPDDYELLEVPFPDQPAALQTGASTRFCPPSRSSPRPSRAVRGRCTRSRSP